MSLQKTILWFSWPRRIPMSFNRINAHVELMRRFAASRISSAQTSLPGANSLRCRTEKLKVQAGSEVTKQNHCALKPARGISHNCTFAENFALS